MAQYENKNGSAMKWWWHFNNNDGSGVVIDSNDDAIIKIIDLVVVAIARTLTFEAAHCKGEMPSCGGCSYTQLCGVCVC